MKVVDIHCPLGAREPVYAGATWHPGVPGCLGISLPYLSYLRPMRAFVAQPLPKIESGVHAFHTVVNSQGQTFGLAVNVNVEIITIRLKDIIP